MNEVMSEVSLRRADEYPTKEEIASFRTRAADHFHGAVEIQVVTQLDQANETELFILEARPVEEAS